MKCFCGLLPEKRSPEENIDLFLRTVFIRGKEMNWSAGA
jgi:hypothetical protein